MYIHHYVYRYTCTHVQTIFCTLFWKFNVILNICMSLMYQTTNSSTYTFSTCTTVGCLVHERHTNIYDDIKLPK